MKRFIFGSFPQDIHRVLKDLVEAAGVELPPLSLFFHSVKLYPRGRAGRGLRSWVAPPRGRGVNFAKCCGLIQNATFKSFSDELPNWSPAPNSWTSSGRPRTTNFGLSWPA